MAERTSGAISIGNSGNLTGGQAFLALDTGEKITRFQWTELPMPAAVIKRVNQLGKNEPSILTFTNRHGQEIGDTTQDFDPGVNDELTGVDQMGNAEPAGVDTDFDMEPTGVDFDTKPTGVDFDAEPTGVKVEADHGNVHDPVPQEQVETHQGDRMDGLGQQVPTPSQWGWMQQSN